MTTLLVLYLVGGLLLVVVALPMLWGKVPPNSLYGLRVAATMENPALWYPVNGHAAKRLIVSGVCLAAAAILLWLVPGITVGGYALGCLAVFAVVFGVGLAQSFRYLRALGAAQAPSNPST